jgi:F-type H+-transporting ATPase subunit a
LENKQKWRFGVNRWFILVFSILTWIGVSIWAPVRPYISVAAEKMAKEPILGLFYWTNSFNAMLLGDVVILLIAFLIYRSTKSGSLVPGGLSGAMEALMEVLYNLTESSAGKWAKQIFPWFATIMLLVLVTNLLKMLPGFEAIGFMEHAEHGGGNAIKAIGGEWYVLTSAKAAEGEAYILAPWFRGLSTDLNFTASLAIISVLMTQVIGFRAQGIRYLLKFFNISNLFKKPFFGFMDLIVGLLELISEFAKILSFSFRLFGVMFSGVVLVALIATLHPVLAGFFPSLVYMFELFMGVIQAFVFGMLTMVFMAQATQGHGGEEHAEEHA